MKSSRKHSILFATPMLLAFVLAGAQTNAQGYAIIDAARGGHVSRVQELARSGVDLNVKGPDGQTALMAASGYCYLEVMKLLLADKADVNVKMGDGTTALVLAAESACLREHDAVEMLLDTGADVNARSSSIGTALMAASANGDLKIVRALLNAGADVNAKTNRGEMALKFAKKRHHAASVQLLQSQ